MKENNEPQLTPYAHTPGRPSTNEELEIELQGKIANSFVIFT